MDGKGDLQAAQPVMVDPRVASRGGAPGGYYSNESYCGIITTLLGIFLCCPCVVCCPCDNHEVYVEPSGRKIIL